MKFLLNTKWVKSLIAKAIEIGLNKRAGIKADLDIVDLNVVDDEEGANLHLDLNVRMSRDELEKLIKDLL